MRAWLIALATRNPSAYSLAAISIIIGALALTAVGADFLDHRHAPTWLKWSIGVAWALFVCFVGMVLNVADDDWDEDEGDRA